ncbi:MAG: TrkA C-terminal domain-containing protein [Opitutales bacterium]
MIPIITLLLVIAFSMVVTKIATIALVNTGMTREMARFQARSALSGAGFTTQAAEDVVTHPVRRRIVSLLILLGSAGLVTAISSLLLGFVGGEGSRVSDTQNLLILGGGVLLLFLSTRSQRLDRLLSRLIQWGLERYSRLQPRSFSELIHVTGDYTIAELECDDIAWLANKTLREAGLQDEGVLVLGIYRDDETYLGTPRGDYRIRPTDRLVIYGRRDTLSDLSERADPLEGKQRHAEATRAQAEEQSEQDAENARAERKQAANKRAEER